ncbi:hypothetical protein E4K67_20670 [Desulfosporosinus fructosivorans]|uniref:DUF4367 domain-containing protein n=1 Tax=Desulfosporosinus fructosivorans TaxID=2018669 RepID=A0A4Z0R1U1_9FIRM|nr:hypothetical protein [Desulfosporosinus fructosivorans]TGE36345.1 hypothetical protein E4K67_20670 [Desulfosporosinus fructosivorans]
MKKHILLGIILGICFTLIALSSLLSVNYGNSTVLNHNYNYQLPVHLPHTTKVIETPLSERGQLLYSVYLVDQTLLIRGYIQKWKLDDLEDYLVYSKRISTFDFQSYSLKPIKLANHNGYITEWTASFGESYRISGQEYWLKKSAIGEVLRISFFTDTTSFSNEQIEYIKKFTDSINWSKFT